jgi:uncharacterized protein YbjQ (UPF0145 family)
MIVTASDSVPGRKVVEVLGAVTGSGTAIGSNYLARKKATQRMVEYADCLGADAIINIQYRSRLFKWTAEGTAVRLGS